MNYFNDGHKKQPKADMVEFEIKAKALKEVEEMRFLLKKMTDEELAVLWKEISDSVLNPPPSQSEVVDNRGVSVISNEEFWKFYNDKEYCFKGVFNAISLKDLAP
jgi:hypothetical protein